jgi:integrase
LVEQGGKPVAVVAGFLRHLAARGCSPNTVLAYAYDLLHFWRFLAQVEVTWDAFAPRHSLRFLEHLREVSSLRDAQRLGIALVVAMPDGEAQQRLSPATINRVLAAVSSFYEFLVISDQLGGRENPIEKRADATYPRVTDRHQPFMGRSSRQRPLRRAVRVKSVERLPRPLSDDQVQALLGALRRRCDQALVRLMLEGGLRPGEVLGLRLEDIAYGHRRVVVRHRDDHPRGARSKSFRERVVDLHEPGALSVLSDYVMLDRPTDTDSPYVFLVGGNGERRTEPLGYSAVVKLFARACERAGIREPWVTPHALRHTHATRMWEGGMRELTLQRRLGHSSIESTRLYTRVSDAELLADYRRALGGTDQ